ncbi:unnamed protein product [Gongylonema pulchrum]|uniref:Secreted protein n=1 Tax=Gongylonema pulchrum TaxID=637853 RepID=A0A183D1L3_9BILA|nr:unnamed protein product [Gongylonema pulchrum]
MVIIPGLFSAVVHLHRHTEALSFTNAAAVPASSYCRTTGNTFHHCHAENDYMLEQSMVTGAKKANGYYGEFSVAKDV